MLGQVFAAIGKDWTQSGITKLFTDIEAAAKRLGIRAPALRRPDQLLVSTCGDWGAPTPLSVAYVGGGALVAECTAPQMVQVASELLGVMHAAAASFRF